MADEALSAGDETADDAGERGADRPDDAAADDALETDTPVAVEADVELVTAAGGGPPAAAEGAPAEGPKPGGDRDDATPAPTAEADAPPPEDAAVTATESAAEPGPAAPADQPGGEGPEALFAEATAEEPVATAGDDEPDATGIPDPLDGVLLELERLSLRVDELRRLSERHMEHIDRLHAENQQLRAGELRQAMSPVLRALLRHHDNVAKLAGSYETGSGEAQALDIVRRELLGVLSMAGVEAFEVAADEPFDPARHQGVSRTETDDAARDGRVAQMRRCGFMGDDGRVIRPAEVDVYRLR